MTRIVGGSAGGRRLEVPGTGTRPTSERAREALFNSLASMIDIAGASVLDLYAGSGAVGLEALSRGAARAVLVESDRAAADIVRRNAAALGLSGAEVVRADVAAYVRPTESVAHERFDLVFADPPYVLDDDALAAVLGDLVPSLTADAVIVVERASRSPEPLWPQGLWGTKHRRYGDAALWYGRRDERTE